MLGQKKKDNTKNETNSRKLLVKEGRLKKYRQTDKTRQSNTMKDRGENARTDTNYQMKRKQHNFGEKYGNRESITEKPNE